MTAPVDVLEEAGVETPPRRRRGVVIGAIAVLVLVLAAYFVFPRTLLFPYCIPRAPADTINPGPRLHPKLA